MSAKILKGKRCTCFFAIKDEYVVHIIVVVFEQQVAPRSYAFSLVSCLSSLSSLAVALDHNH